MSDLVIPEDLRHQHNIATVAYSVQCYTGREVARLIERIARAEMHNHAAVECERKDCTRALAVLSGAGICTPEETYGTNTSWAISDLCRAVAALEAENGRLQSALATSIAQTAAWNAEANQLTVANDQKAGRIIKLQEQVRDAEHLCKWLLQADTSDADRERVIRENGCNFAIALARTESTPTP